MQSNRTRRRGSSPARICPQCGASFYRTPSKPGVYCTNACRIAAGAHIRSTPAETRFWSHVDRRGPDECWPWTAATDRDGYGVFTLRPGEQIGAHAYSYELAYGPLPDGLITCHTCDNPPCCNPAHLWAGTHADNLADRDAKGRLAFGSRHGRTHLTEDDVRTIRAWYADGESQQAIASRYGVSQVAISCIVLRKTWKHV